MCEEPHSILYIPFNFHTVGENLYANVEPTGSSTTLHQVCPRYSGQGVREVPHFAAPAPATPRTAPVAGPFHLWHSRFLRLLLLSVLLPIAPVWLLLVPIRLLCFVFVWLCCSCLGSIWWLIRRLFFITYVDRCWPPRCLLLWTLPFQSLES